MCEWNKFGDTRIDPCMRRLIRLIDSHPSIKVMMCCCGHGRYNMTIIIRYVRDVQDKKVWLVRELLSGIELPKRTKYYKRDKDGYYYIPECVN